MKKKLTFDEKIDRVEVLFSKSKSLEFLNPMWGIYSSVIGVALAVSGFGGFASLVFATSITVSTIGITLTFISAWYSKRAWDLIEQSFGDFEIADSTEMARQINRQKKAIEIIVPTRS